MNIDNEEIEYQRYYKRKNNYFTHISLTCHDKDKIPIITYHKNNEYYVTFSTKELKLKLIFSKILFEREISRKLQL